jgi:hypothetical protein
LAESKLENERICSRQFISGRPADLSDELKPDWLPTQNWGHTKIHTVTAFSRSTYERKKASTVSRRLREEKALDEVVVNVADGEEDLTEERLLDKEVETEANGQEVDSLCQ